MFHPLLEFGGILFWIIAGVLTLVLASQVEEEKTGWAGLTLIVGLATIIMFTDSPIPGMVAAHPVYILYGVLGYLAIAAVWALIKWRMFYLPKLFDRYDELRIAFLKKNGLKEFPADPAVRKEFNQQSTVSRLDIQHNRMVSYNKARITGWMIFWPFSLIGTFIGDFLYRVFTSLYKAIAGMLQRMSDSMASRYSELN